MYCHSPSILLKQGSLYVQILNNFFLLVTPVNLLYYITSFVKHECWSWASFMVVFSGARPVRAHLRSELHFSERSKIMLCCSVGGLRIFTSNEIKNTFVRFCFLERTLSKFGIYIWSLLINIHTVILYVGSLWCCKGVKQHQQLLGNTVSHQRFYYTV